MADNSEKHTLTIASTKMKEVPEFVDQKLLGHAVKLLRQPMGIKVAVLYKKLGVSENTFRRFENGEGILNPASLAKLPGILECDSQEAIITKAAAFKPPEPIDRIAFGQAMLAMRLSKGMTQTEIGNKIHLSRVGIHYLEQPIELAHKSARLDHKRANAIADVFGFSSHEAMLKEANDPSKIGSLKNAATVEATIHQLFETAYNIEFALAAKKLRNNAGLTTKQIAPKLSMSAKSYSVFETTASTLSAKTTEKLLGLNQCCNPEEFIKKAAALPEPVDKAIFGKALRVMRMSKKITADALATTLHADVGTIFEIQAGKQFSAKLMQDATVALGFSSPQELIQAAEPLHKTVPPRAITYAKRIISSKPVASDLWTSWIRPAPSASKEEKQEPANPSKTR